MAEKTVNNTVEFEEKNVNLIHRLHRIEGQIHGLNKMVSNDEHFNNLVVQILAVNAALNSFSKLLVDQYLLSNVTPEVKNVNKNTMEDLISVLEKVIK